ncbi:MAG TPA: HD domain-containing phosphohydrolase [Lacipirellulaceae bacterium]|nr:HD domain-containing phosphohydrolase [Lacipirellulaceae bacterium]
MLRNELSPANQIECRTALIVDDDHAVCDLLSGLLTREGWNCSVANNAADALAQMELAPAQVVVADIQMPGQSGFWLLGQITARFPDTSVLMLTGSRETRTAIEALTRGACGYLLKPIQRKEFLFQIRQAWAKRQLILERRNYLQMLERRVEEQTLTIRRAHEETIHCLVAATACRDQETGAHVRRTGLLSEALAVAAGWSRNQAELLRMAAPMHDVGKIGIPDAILQKPGKLTTEEFERMKQHTTIGARMLAGSDSPVLQLAEKIALCHHERWNGSGYPNGLAGQDIPEAARILAIVDVYDALSHNRVYRSALPEDRVLAAMRAGHGSHFDPTLLPLFFDIFEQIREIADAHPDVTESFEAGQHLPRIQPRTHHRPALADALNC